MVCPLWANLELRTAGDSSKIFYRLTPDTFFVSYYNMALKGTNGRIRATFQMTFTRLDSALTINYRSFDSDVEVHFQKVSPVVVRLLQASGPLGTGKTVHEERSPIYTRTWFVVGAAVLVVGAAALIGYAAGDVPCYVNGNMSDPC